MRAVLALLVLLVPVAAVPASGQTPVGVSAQAARPGATPDVVEPQGYTYDPAGRRDPFVSLLRGGAVSSATSSAAARAPGLAGLGVADVTLKGTLRSRDGYLAMLLGADNKTYVVRPGDRLADGAVRSVADGAVVLVQQIDDPLSPQRQREVRKVLRQTEEAR